jgi:elongator complex protein 2
MILRTTQKLIEVGSPDQTTRIHSTCNTGNRSGVWREVCRPQVHGYDLLDIVSLGLLSFASIADEKTVRIFEAPLQFIRYLKYSGYTVDTDEVYPSMSNLEGTG